MLPFLGGLVLGAGLGTLVAAMCGAAKKGDSELYLATMCQGKVNGKPCTHLALPGAPTCRQHSISPVTRNTW